MTLRVRSRPRALLSRVGFLRLFLVLLVSAQFSVCAAEFTLVSKAQSHLRDAQAALMSAAAQCRATEKTLATEEGADSEAFMKHKDKVMNQMKTDAKINHVSLATLNPKDYGLKVPPIPRVQFSD